MIIIESKLNLLTFVVEIRQQLKFRRNLAKIVKCEIIYTKFFRLNILAFKIILLQDNYYYEIVTG